MYFPLSLARISRYVGSDNELAKHAHSRVKVALSLFLVALLKAIQHSESKDLFRQALVALLKAESVLRPVDQRICLG